MVEEYFISDHHFHHANIIDYCDRPFSDVEEMNSRMIEKWNKVVDNEDIVYHLGDLTFKGKEKANELNRVLNGNIIMIRGNHDSYSTADFPILEEFSIKRKGITFKCFHRPDSEFEEWLIHGHKHNNEVSDYPFYNPQGNKINVSVELTDYKPVNVEDIIDIIKSRNVRVNKRSNFDQK